MCDAEPEDAGPDFVLDLFAEDADADTDVDALNDGPRDDSDVIADADSAGDADSDDVALPDLHGETDTPGFDFGVPDRAVSADEDNDETTGAEFRVGGGGGFACSAAQGERGSLFWLFMGLALIRQARCGRRRSKSRGTVRSVISSS